MTEIIYLMIKFLKTRRYKPELEFIIIFKIMKLMEKTKIK